jgi:hypothetical protein
MQAVNVSLRILLTGFFVCLSLLVGVHWTSQADEKPKESQDSTDPDETLSQKDLNRLLTLSRTAIDKRNNVTVRSKAILELQRMSHSHGLAALLAVAHDDSNSIRLRTEALLAASRTPDKLVVDHLIEFIGDEQSYDFAYNANCRLYWITGRDRKTYEPLPKDPTSEHRLRIQGEWQEWWRKNHENVTYSLEEPTSGGMGVGCFPGFFPSDEK